MRQRVMIAMALACNPKVIIADEPTTALDVTIQAQILDLLRHLKDKINSSIMLITHDLGVIAEMADYVVVMYAGRIVEKGTAEEIFENPCHPYTIGLMASKPVVGKQVDELYSIPGKVPNPINMPNYCYFKDRCEMCVEGCEGAYPTRFGCLPPIRSAAIATMTRKREGSVMSLNKGIADGVACGNKAKTRRSSSRSRRVRRSVWPRASRVRPRPTSLLKTPTAYPVEYDPSVYSDGQQPEEVFPHQGRHGLPDCGPGQGCGWRHLQPEAGHHHGPGGRVRLRQDHHRPHHPAAVRRKDRRSGAVQRPGGL